MNNLSYLWEKLFEYEIEFFFLCLYVLFRPFRIISDVSSSFGARLLGYAIIFLMCFGSSLFCVGKDEFKIIRSGIVVTL